MAGNKTTTTGVLFTKAEISATSTSRININFEYPYLQKIPKKSVICSIILHLFNAALITNIAAIVIGASAEKTERISL